MVLDDLVRGDNIDIILELDKNNELKYDSTFLGYSNGTLLIIMEPVSDTLEECLKTVKLKLMLVHENNPYVFYGDVIETINHESGLVLKIINISDFTQVQRRNHFRLKMLLPMKYRVMLKAGGTIKYLSYKDTNIIDISAGGVSFLIHEELDHDTLIECCIMIEEDNPLKVLGRIRRVSKSDTKGKWVAAVMFAGLSNRETERLVTYILKQQAALRRRGMI